MTENAREHGINKNTHKYIFIDEYCPTTGDASISKDLYHLSVLCRFKFSNLFRQPVANRLTT